MDNVKLIKQLRDKAGEEGKPQPRWWLNIRCLWYQLNIKWNKFWFARRFKKNAGSYSIATENRMHEVLSEAKQANIIRHNAIEEFLKERRKFDIQIDD